jgi:hypothetical protein
VRDFTVVIRPGADTVETPGVNFGGRVRLVHRREKHAVLHVRGGSHWGGIGSRGSHPSSWMLVHVEDVTVSATQSLTGRAFTRTRVVVLEEIEPGAQWRTTKARLVARCNTDKCDPSWCPIAIAGLRFSKLVSVATGCDAHPHADVIGKADT